MIGWNNYEARESERSRWPEWNLSTHWTPVVTPTQSHITFFNYYNLFDGSVAVHRSEEKQRWRKIWNILVVTLYSKHHPYKNISGIILIIYRSTTSEQRKHLHRYVQRKGSCLASAPVVRIWGNSSDIHLNYHLNIHLNIHPNIHLNIHRNIHLDTLDSQSVCNTVCLSTIVHYLSHHFEALSRMCI